jgi:hypothetical protein
MIDGVILEQVDAPFYPIDQIAMHSIHILLKAAMGLLKMNISGNINATRRRQYRLNTLNVIRLG